MVLSFLIASCEEIAFRGLIPHVVKSSICRGNLAATLITQAFLFGSLHVSLSWDKDDYFTVPVVQLINGFWLGYMYLISNGDILVCIVAHAVSHPPFCTSRQNKVLY